MNVTTRSVGADGVSIVVASRFSWFARDGEHDGKLSGKLILVCVLLAGVRLPLDACDARPVNCEPTIPRDTSRVATSKEIPVVLTAVPVMSSRV